MLHDNARPHVAMRTKETILELRWEVFPYPADYPDMAPSDNHLFRSMKHLLQDKSFKENQDLQNLSTRIIKQFLRLTNILN